MWKEGNVDYVRHFEKVFPGMFYVCEITDYKCCSPYTDSFEKDRFRLRDPASFSCLWPRGQYHKTVLTILYLRGALYCSSQIHYVHSHRVLVLQYYEYYSLARVWRSMGTPSSSRPRSASGRSNCCRSSRPPPAAPPSPSASGRPAENMLHGILIGNERAEPPSLLPS